MTFTPPDWYGVTPAEEMAAAVSAAGEELAAVLSGITLLVLDADGVLTDGTLVYGPQGESCKNFNARDGLGLVLAEAAGVQRAVLTGRDSPIVARRAGELRFEAIKLGRFDKAAALDEILAETGCDPAHTLYMGDDLIDLAAMVRVGLPVTVPEAPAAVRAACRLVTENAGGRGAVREITDLLLCSRGELGQSLGRLSEPGWKQSAQGMSSEETE